MPAATIEFHQVSRRFGNVAAVNDVSFTIEAGELVTLLGPSGCGKTTVLRLIAGLEMPDSGTIRIGGADVSGAPAFARDVSMVFQSYALFPHMSTLENVGYGLTVSGMKIRAANDRARQALATVGLEGFDTRLPSELSGGQQQRVALARALVLEPAVLLFDEPLSNLDARLRRQMRDEIRDLQRRLGLTVVYVTHDQAEAMAVADRIVVMNQGMIAQQGSPRELYEAPSDAFVASFMGDANRVSGTLTRVDATLGKVRIGEVTLDLPHRGLAEGPIQVAIRPESIVFVADRVALLAGTIRKATYLGTVMEYNVDTPVGELFATSPAVESPRRAGDAVGIAFASHGVVLLPAVT